MSSKEQKTPDGQAPEEIIMDQHEEVEAVEPDASGGGKQIHIVIIFGVFRFSFDDFNILCNSKYEYHGIFKIILYIYIYIYTASQLQKSS